MEAAEAAIAAAEAKSATAIHKYEDKIETALSKISDSVLTDVPADQKALVCNQSILKEMKKYLQD